MGQTVSFDYFYGGQSDAFSYYRIPRLLITGQQFKGLSTDAKLLYGLLLDRMGLSSRNGWYDELGRVYITGGLCAYGYQYVKLGRTNRRKQEVFDLAICEEEAFVVRIIFRLAADEGYGAQRIANHLNAKGVKNRSGKNWHPASIQGMLKNILYTGILRSGESRSEVQEHLRIIDDKTFAAVQEMLAARSRRQEAIRSKPLNTRGKSLLAGNIFCGHCGARLCITTSGKGRRRQDGTDVVRMRYTCQTKSRTHGECDGQTGYTVEKLDAMIGSIIQGIFSRVRSLNRKDVVNACVSNDLNAKKAFLRKTQKDYEKAEKDLQRLKSEIVNALTGASAFSLELLNSVIQEQSQRCEELRNALNEAEKDYAESDSQIEVRSQQYDDLLEWSAAYETASISAKKVIVARMIERVDVYRGYQLKLKLNISVEQFLVSLENIKAPGQAFTA